MTMSKNGNFRQKMKAIPFVFLPNSAIFSPCQFLMNLNSITPEVHGNAIRVGKYSFIMVFYVNLKKGHF